MSHYLVSILLRGLGRRKFYGGLNNITSALGKCTNEIIALDGVKSCCLPSLKFGIWLTRVWIKSQRQGTIIVHFLAFVTTSQFTPALQQLRWLLVERRIKYKLCTLSDAPDPHWTCTLYLVDSMQSVAESSRRPGLRSANTVDYVKRHTRTKFGERCFSHAGTLHLTVLSSSLAV